MSTVMYPQIDPKGPVKNNYNNMSIGMYPQIDPKDLVKNNFFSKANEKSVPGPPQSAKEHLLTVPGAIVHLIDKTYSVELACGDLSLVRLVQDDKVVAVLVHVANEVEWPLANTQAAVKLDDSHYFFSLNVPSEGGESGSGDDSLNYGLTFASKGQEGLLKELDRLLEQYSSFTKQEVKTKGEEYEVLDGTLANKVSPENLKSEKEKKAMEEKCAAYWTTLAPNVEDYSGRAAKMIATGSGHVIKGILWCGDVTIDRLTWGNKVLKNKMKPLSESEISPETLKRIQRVKTVTKMTHKVASGVLSGVLKVSGYVTSSAVNSKAGKKFFNLLPGELVLASMDGFSKVCDAVEMTGKNVMSTSSDVTTGLVSHRYGGEAAKATKEGLGATGHAFGTAWSVLKLRNALNPKSAMKSSVKSAAKAAAMK